jgi:hypothetical protein
MLRRYRLEIVLVAAIVLIAATFVRWNAIPSFADRHVQVAEERYSFEVGEPGPWFSAWSLGDGLVYVLIGIDPSGEHLASEILEVGYRFARAGYGWAGWAVSLGQERFVPQALAIVGGLSVLGLLRVAVRMRPRLGPRTWLMVFNPALFIGVAADTSEPLGILLLAAGMASGSWVAAVLLGVTRPTFLLGLWPRWKLFVPGILAAVSLALYSLVTFGAETLFRGGGRLTFPLLAYIEHPSLWRVLLAVLATATVVVGVGKRDWSWVVSGLFVLCFGFDVLRAPTNAWRAAGLIPVLWAFGPGYRIGSATGSMSRMAQPLSQPADVS